MSLKFVPILVAAVLACLAVAHAQQDASGAACVSWSSEWRQSGVSMNLLDTQGFLQRVPQQCGATRAAAQQRLESLQCAQARSDWQELRNTSNLSVLRNFRQRLPASCVGPRDLADARLSDLEARAVCEGADAAWDRLRTSEDINAIEAFFQQTPSGCASSRLAQARLNGLHRAFDALQRINSEYEADFAQEESRLRSGIASNRRLPPELANFISNRINLRVCEARPGQVRLPTPQAVLGGSNVLEANYTFGGAFTLGLRGFDLDEVDEERTEIRGDVIDSCSDVRAMSLRAAQEKAEILP